VAWYKLGARPGQPGSAVIAGHLDNALSLKGVFFHLDKLKAGDTVSVQTRDGSEAVFQVIGSQVYDYKGDAASEVFTSSDGKAYLNLVTCDGVWIQSEKSYDQRLVVFTTLVSILPPASPGTPY
jgi:LPXTG-site transpeptidase (sortase) family protein